MKGPTPPPAETDKDRSNLTRKQIRGSALLMAGRGISLCLNFAVQVLVVRYLSKLDYGAFAYALAITDVATRLALFGMDKAASRYAAIYHERQDHGRLFGSLILMSGTIIGLGLGSAVTLFGLRGLLGSAVVSNPLSLTLLLSLIVLAPVEAMNLLIQSVFAVLARARFIFFRRYVVGPGLKLAAVLVVVALHGEVRLLATVYVIAGSAGLLIGLALVLRMFRETALIAHFHPSRLKMPVREIFAFAMPLMVSDVMFMLRSSLGVLMLEYFQSSRSVADFRAVLSLARLNRGVLDSFGILFIPMMVRLLVRNESRAVNELFWRSTSWIIVLTFPVFAATFSLARPVTIAVFREQYSGSASILALLSLGMFLSASFGLNSLALRAAGKVRLVLLIDSAALLALFSLNLVLIPRYDAVGGALSFLGTSLLHTLMYQLVLSRSTSIGLLPWKCAKLLLTVGLAVVALSLVQTLFSPPIYLGIPLVGLAWMPVLAVGGRLLEIGQTFPELLRIPAVPRLIEAMGWNKADSVKEL